MKKLLLVVLALMLSASISFAQETKMGEPVKTIAKGVEAVSEYVGKVVSVTVAEPAKGVTDNTVKVTDEMGNPISFTVSSAAKITDASLNAITLNQLKEGEKVTLESGAEAEVLGRGEVGRYIKFNRPIEEILESGHMPLPPYIDRLDEPDDRSAYQTVYAAKEGATASPTAGLHFTQALFDRLSSIGIRVSFVTLHTSYGTFAPIKTDNVESHKMHKEYFEIPAGTIEAIRETKSAGGKIIAVGTTSARSLEYWAREGKAEGDNDLFIYPGFKFKIVDHLITNFHLPKSTLMLLTSAFAGKDFIFEAYHKAIEERYRFFSYGDSMLIL